MNKDNLEKIKRRHSKNYKIEEVFFNTNLEENTIKYLKKQNYLDYNKIKEVLKINYMMDYPFGHALTYNGNVVGFLGTMYSQRIINNKSFIFCYLHTWIVDKNHRLSSYLLLLPIIQKNCCIMTFTPIKTLLGLYQKFGLIKIEMKYKIMFINKFTSFFKKKIFYLEKNYEIFKDKLNKNDLKIYHDHSNIVFKKFIIYDIKDKSKFTFMISTIIKKKLVNVINLIYLSDILFFKKNSNEIMELICKEFNVFFCGQYFINENDCYLPNNRKLSRNFVSNICVKNLPQKMKFNVLYSEII